MDRIGAHYSDPFEEDYFDNAPPAPVSDNEDDLFGGEVAIGNVAFQPQRIEMQNDFQTLPVRMTDDRHNHNHNHKGSNNHNNENFRQNTEDNNAVGENNTGEALPLNQQGLAGNTFLDLVSQRQMNEPVVSTASKMPFQLPLFVHPARRLEGDMARKRLALVCMLKNKQHGNEYRSNIRGLGRLFKSVKLVLKVDRLDEPVRVRFSITKLVETQNQLFIFPAPPDEQDPLTLHNFPIFRVFSGPSSSSSSAPSSSSPSPPETPPQPPISPSLLVSPFYEIPPSPGIPSLSLRACSADSVAPDSSAASLLRPLSSSSSSSSTSPSAAGTSPTAKKKVNNKRRMPRLMTWEKVLRPDGDTFAMITLMVERYESTRQSLPHFQLDVSVDGQPTLTSKMRIYHQSTRSRFEKMIEDEPCFFVMMENNPTTFRWSSSLAAFI